MAIIRFLLWAAIASATFSQLAADATAAILSSKRGFADVGANYDSLQATGAGWYYTWAPEARSSGGYNAQQFPHISRSHHATTSQVSNIRNRGGVEWVLGFNEPERPDQANMTVEQAITAWQNVIAPGLAGSGIKLVSPAVSDSGSGPAWLASFMQQADALSLPVDAVAFHWYGVSNPNNPAGAASSFLSRVDAYHNAYNLPVFITEFAIHDWGNAYSDEAIIEANRQFLNIVVPALESRSYVAGYAWYPWFSDSRLYEGTPAVPTPMSYAYIGAVGAGQSENIAGQVYGEHVAYLTGGDLTRNGAAATQLRYINALEGASTVSGTVDWALDPTGWVRIQPDATLRKTGANTITFNSGSITNNGALEVAAGRLRIGATVSGPGKVHVNDGGTLALFGRGDVSAVPLLEVRSGGTLDATEHPRGLNLLNSLLNGQTLDVKQGGVVDGAVTAVGGATIAGGGHFTNSVAVRTGSFVRVGIGAAGAPSRFLVDDFESYALGDVRTTASPTWTAHQNTSLADIENFNGSKVLTYGWANEPRGASRSLPDEILVENDQTATFFFRINSKTGDPDHNFGLGDRATPANVDFGDYEAQLRMKQGTTANTFAVDAQNGGGFSATLASDLALNTWYNIWMVVDQTTDTYDLYMNTGGRDAGAENKLNATPLAFRNGTASALNSILAFASPAPIDNGARIDDLYFFRGFDLTNPLVDFDPGNAWNAETMTIDGNLTLDFGATLQIDLGGASAGQFDVLDVGGTALLDGNLEISLADGFLPAPGELFPILNAMDVAGSLSLTGAAAGFSLVHTSDGLSLYFGELPPGDYDRNGTVDEEDYTLWKNAFGTSVTTPGAGADGNGDSLVDAGDYTIWRNNFGSTIFSGSASLQQDIRVPEPGTLVSFAIALTLTSLNAGRHRRAPSDGRN